MIQIAIVMCLAFSFYSESAPFPIEFSISETKIIPTISKKHKDFAYITPFDLQTYIYDEESDYYTDYQQSYFAITSAKAGWDCMRHYEILANGCIPYFVDLEKCPQNTMTFFPKDLILEAMNLEGVTYLKIDHSKFDLLKYYDLLNKLIQHTREHLTTKKMAEYVLKKIGYTGNGKILYLTENTYPDYLRCTILTGLKESLGARIVDVPKIEHIYKSYSQDTKQLYGKGFSYSKIIEDLPIDREDIESRIKAREFDLVIYGALHRGLRHHDLVKQCYDSSKIIYLCGEDSHICDHNISNLFAREQ